MTSEQFAEWMAYYKIEPFGERHRDLSLGLIGATVANFAPFSKRTRPYTVDKFMSKTPAEMEIKSVKRMDPVDIKEFFIDLKKEQQKKAALEEKKQAKKQVRKVSVKPAVRRKRINKKRTE